MRRVTTATIGVVVAAGALALGLLPGVSSAGADPALGAARAACAPVPAHSGLARCFAQYRVPSGARAATDDPPGWSPADIASAYGLSGSGGSGRVVSIVDAADDPNAEHDLAVYRAQFGLPACTTANGCFSKVNEFGDASPLPEPDPNWGVEISLDLDAVSAACPQCSIRLVEADTPSFRNLGIAESTAVRLGSIAVSNSYGGNEYDGFTRYSHYYEHPGTSIVASTGDYGYGLPASFPADLDTTIAVGGTTLKRADNAHGWTETAWSGAGSACSAYIAKPAWQHDTHCGMRTLADISAVADSDPGLAVYDTFGLGSFNGFITVGGTSLSSPLIAAMITRSGHELDGAQSLYQRHGRGLYDPHGGSNGFCGGDYLCTGVRGYDGPTGVGSPRGLGAL